MSQHFGQGVPVGEFRRQRALQSPAGYICLLRDVSYGDRYQLLILESPQELARRGRHEFETELALVFKSPNALRSGRWLLNTYGEHAGWEEWFDLDDARFEELRASAHSWASAEQPRRRNSAQHSGDIWQSQRARQRKGRQQSESSRQARRRHRAVVPPSPAPRERSRAAPAARAAAAPGRRRFSLLHRLTQLLILVLVAGLGYGLLTERDPVEDLLVLLPADMTTTTEPQLRLVSKSAEWVRIAWDRVPGLSYELRFKLDGGRYSSWESKTNGLSVGYYVRGGLQPDSSYTFQMRAWRGPVVSALGTLAVRTGSAPTVAARSTTAFSATHTPIPPENTATSLPPTASAAHSSVATVASTVIPTLGSYFVETANNMNANVRACPHMRTSCEIVARLAPGTEVMALARAQGDAYGNSREWLRVSHEGMEGFVHAVLLEKRG